MKSVFFLSFYYCFCVQNYVFLLKMMFKEKKNTKSQPKKIVCETMNFGSKKFTKPTKNL